jgi:uncharacterized protein YndB with AHSA1/START domain
MLAVAERRHSVIKFQLRIEIDRSPDEVFALLSDVERVPAWQHSVTAVTKITAGPARAGSEFKETMRVMGRARQATVTIAAHRPPELIAFAGDAGFADYYCVFELAPATGGGTLLLTRTEFQLHGLWRMLGPVFAGELRRETMQELEALKRTLEAAVRAGA